MTTPAAPARAYDGSYARGLGYSVLSFVSSGFLAFVTSVVTARLFGVKVIGEFALAMAPAASLWFLSTVREQVALVRELATLPPRAPRVTGIWLAVFSFSMALTLAVSIATGAVAYVAFNGPIDHPELFVPAVVLLATNVFILNVSSNLDQVFSGFVAGRILFWVRLHEVALLLILSLAAGIWRPTLWGLVAANSIAVIPPLLQRIVAVRRYMAWRPEPGELRKGFRDLPGMLRWSVKMAPGAIMAGVSWQSCTWILGTLSTVAAVGAFNRAQMLAGRFQQLTTRIVQMLFPTLVARRASGDRLGFDRALVETMRITTVMTLIIPAVGGGAAPAVMSVFGSGFAPAADALALLLLTPTLINLCGIQAYGLFAVDRPGLVSWITALRLVVTLAVGIPLTLQLGLMGPVIGLVAGLLAEVWCKHVGLRAHLSAPLHELWSRRAMIGLVASGAIGYAVARALTRVVPYPIGLPVILLGGAIAYCAAYLALVGLSRRDAERLAALRARLHRRLPRWVVAPSKP